MNGGRRRGLSLLEVMVSSALLLGLVYVLASSSWTVKRATSESQQGLDMDTHARRTLDELRRDLRRSGWARDGTAMLTTPPDVNPISVIQTARQPAPAAAVDLLVYRTRTGPEPTDWSAPITIRAVPQRSGALLKVTPALNVYMLERVQSGQTVRLAHNVTLARVERLANGGAVRIQLELSSLPTTAEGGAAPTPVSRTYRDQVQMLNLGPDQ